MNYPDALRIRLEPELRAAVQARAEENGMSQSELIRYALMQLVAPYKVGAGLSRAGRAVQEGGVAPETSLEAPGRRQAMREVTVRVTAAEYAGLVDLAHRGGFKGRATKYLRAQVRALLNGRAEGGVSQEQLQVLGQIAWQLGKYGQNLNQLARAVNTDLKAGRAPPPSHPNFAGMLDVNRRVLAELRELEAYRNTYGIHAH